MVMARVSDQSGDSPELTKLRFSRRFKLVFLNGIRIAWTSTDSHCFQISVVGREPSSQGYPALSLVKRKLKSQMGVT